MTDVPVVAAVRRPWRSRGRRSRAGHGTQASADRRTDTGTTPAAGYGTDHGSGPGADQAAAQRSLAGIVRIGSGGSR